MNGAPRELELARSPDRLEDEVTKIRGNLTGIMSELDRRRHELLDVRLQLRRHRGKLAIAAGIVLLLAGVSVALGARRRRRELRALTRMRRMRRALARFIDDPDRGPLRPELQR